MSKPNIPSLHLTAAPVYLAASAIHNLIGGLPASTAYFIGIVFVTMFTGQLVHQQGSLARAALPYVMHLRSRLASRPSGHGARSTIGGCTL